MDDLVWLGRFAIQWVRDNPVLAGGAALGLVVLWWLLNRKGQLTRDSDRVVKNLTDSSRGKYDDLRPLR